MHRVPISEILICGTRSSGILQDSPHLSVDITHVAAHREGQALSALEEWCFLHNQLADRTAVRANYQRTSQFWSFYHRHVAQVQAAQTITSWVQFVLLTVSQFVLQRPPVPEPKEHRDATLPDPSGLWTGLISFHRLPAAAARYGQKHGQIVDELVFSNSAVLPISGGLGQSDPAVLRLPTYNRFGRSSESSWLDGR